MNKTLNLVGIFQLFLLKSRFNNNSLKLILKCIEPCVDCECPTCDVNIKDGAIVDKDDKDKKDCYSMRNYCICKKYIEYIKKFDHHKFYEQCDCPNCFTFKCPTRFFDNEYILKKMEMDIKLFIKLVDIPGIYIFTIIDYGSSYACYLHCFLMNDGKYRIYRDREFDRFNFFQSQSIAARYIDRDKYIEFIDDDEIMDIKKSNRNTRKFLSTFSFDEYSSIDKFLKNCHGGDLTFLNRYCIDFDDIIDHILKF